MVFFQLPEIQHVLDFTNVNQCMLLISRDSLTNPQITQSTCQTWVNSHKLLSVSPPVNTPNTLYFQGFFYITVDTVFKKSHCHQQAQMCFILRFILENGAFLKVWRKVVSSWKEVEASLPPDSPDSSRNQHFLLNFLFQGLLFFLLTLTGFHQP